MVLTSIVKQL